jgi:hypothetical protein
MWGNFLLPGDMKTTFSHVNKLILLATTQVVSHQIMMLGGARIEETFPQSAERVI